MPPNIHFDHSNIYYNPCLAPLGPLKVGQPTLISISLYNSGDPTATVDVRLWWIGPNAAYPAGPRMDLVNRLNPPGPSPVVFNVMQGSPGTGNLTVSWTPSSTDLPKSLGAFVQGSLFAQAVVQPIVPGYGGDRSALSIWSPVYPLCAQHNVTVATS